MSKLSLNIIRTDVNSGHFDDFQSAIVPLISKYPEHVDTIFNIVGVTRDQYNKMEISKEHLRNAIYLYLKDRSIEGERDMFKSNKYSHITVRNSYVNYY